jgi:hypothetical protein
MVDPSFSYETSKAVLNANVANPFLNYLTPDKFPGSLRNSGTVSVASLLRPSAVQCDQPDEQFRT